MPAITFISYGAGVQSTALLWLASQGKINPAPELAVFADTCNEPAPVYETLERAREWSKIPIVTVSAGDLKKKLIERTTTKVTIPAFVAGRGGNAPAPLSRNCTRDFKASPVNRYIRETALSRGWKDWSATTMLGISLDECHRMKPNPHKRMTNTWPLVDLGLDRLACLDILREAGIPEPMKSACSWCPWRSDRSWLDLKKNHAADWGNAVDMDRKIRRMSGVEGDVYLHRTLRPLEEIEFELLDRQESFDFEGFGNECSGHCGL